MAAHRKINKCGLQCNVRINLAMHAHMGHIKVPVNIPTTHSIQRHVRGSHRGMTPWIVKHIGLKYKV